MEGKWLGRGGMGSVRLLLENNAQAGLGVRGGGGLMMGEAMREACELEHGCVITPTLHMLSRSCGIAPSVSFHSPSSATYTYRPVSCLIALLSATGFSTPVGLHAWNDPLTSCSHFSSSLSHGPFCYYRSRPTPQKMKHSPE
jgi:hypothetical protein